MGNQSKNNGFKIGTSNIHKLAYKVSQWMVYSGRFDDCTASEVRIKLNELFGGDIMRQVENKFPETPVESERRRYHTDFRNRIDGYYPIYDLDNEYEIIWVDCSEDQLLLFVDALNKDAEE